MRIPPIQWLVLLAVVVAGACGTADPDRPVPSSTYPAPGQEVRGNLRSIRLVYDEPVTILNFNDVRVLVDGVFYPTAITQTPSDPAGIWVHPFTDPFYPNPAHVRVEVGQGAVVNGGSQYADAVFAFEFTTARQPDLLVASPTHVTTIDPETLAEKARRALPAGQMPVALTGTLLGTAQRVWLQLHSGLGTSRALAWVDLETAMAVQTIELAPGVSLVGSAATLVTHPERGVLYASYRNEGTGRVLVARVDMKGLGPTGVIELESVDPGAGTAPLGMTLDLSGDRLWISCTDGVDAVLAGIDTLTFTEVDRNAGLPGIQGLALPVGADGPVTTTTEAVWIARPGGVDLVRIDRDTLAVTERPAVATGATRVLAQDLSGTGLLQLLDGFAAPSALLRRLAADDHVAAVAVPSSDAVGGLPAGTTSAAAVTGYYYDGTQRLLVLVQSPTRSVLARLRPDAAGVLVQEDLDPATPALDAFDVGAILPDAHLLGTLQGAFPP